MDYEGGWLTQSRSCGEKKEADKLGLVVDRHFNWTEKKMESLLAQKRRGSRFITIIKEDGYRNVILMEGEGWKKT